MTPSRTSDGATERSVHGNVDTWTPEQKRSRPIVSVSVGMGQSYPGNPILNVQHVDRRVDPRLDLVAGQAGRDDIADADRHHARALGPMPGPDAARVERDRHARHAERPIEAGETRLQRRPLTRRDARALRIDQDRAAFRLQRLGIAHHRSQRARRRLAIGDDAAILQRRPAPEGDAAEFALDDHRRAAEQQLQLQRFEHRLMLGGVEDGPCRALPLHDDADAHDATVEQPVHPRPEMRVPHHRAPAEQRRDGHREHDRHRQAVEEQRKQQPCRAAACWARHPPSR
ncbi:hypothetical protein WR25_13980 [Diploscapter pachys]|uniref:Uncharacterized protein n=1 Tax=Diploscapter pachys TaxID=2018661 RepID=A0A2A2M3S2_9BILA|nr:hypothetical protein WR25_13980 [Diploscapter pachys]